MARLSSAKAPTAVRIRTGPRKIPSLLKASREFLFLGAQAFSLESSEKQKLTKSAGQGIMFVQRPLSGSP